MKWDEKNNVTKSNSAPRSVVIIGGGLSGTLVAVHLLRLVTAPVKITIIEQRAVIGQGVAYSTSFTGHLLNVPASKMSAFADQPNHFLDWGQQEFARQQDLCLQALAEQPSRWLSGADHNDADHNGADPDRSTLLVAEPPKVTGFCGEAAAIQAVTAHTFVSRQLYGRYLQSVLTTAVRNAPAGVQWESITDEAISIHTENTQAAITLTSGKAIWADCVVLAVGNFPPRNPPVADPSFYRSRRYVCSAWSPPTQPNWTQTISKNDAVLLIGSGLTAIDQVVALYQQGHRGKIWLVSRRGCLPQSHQPSISGSTYSIDWSTSLAQPTLRMLVRRVRQEIEWAIAQGHDWRLVIDSLRPVTPRLWQALSHAERRQFLRHVRPYWDVHRHRIAPEIAQLMAQLRQSGQLQICAGRIQSYEEDTHGVDVAIRQRRGDEITVRSNWVINCTGAEDNYSKLQQPLIQQLLAAGLVRPDPLKLGLEANSEGNLVQADGSLSPWLHTLGAPCKGQRWETTAVAEIRVQAKQLAEQIAEQITDPNRS
jgi:uncharacterized NAD(P)/FAD-binding protein YdhS